MLLFLLVSVLFLHTPHIVYKILNMPIHDNICGLAVEIGFASHSFSLHLLLIYKTVPAAGVGPVGGDNRRLFSHPCLRKPHRHGPELVRTLVHENDDPVSSRTCGAVVGSCGEMSGYGSSLNADTGVGRTSASTRTTVSTTPRGSYTMKRVAYVQAMERRRGPAVVHPLHRQYRAHSLAALRRYRRAVHAVHQQFGDSDTYSRRDACDLRRRVDLHTRRLPHSRRTVPVHRRGQQREARPFGEREKRWRYRRHKEGSDSGAHAHPLHDYRPPEPQHWCARVASRDTEGWNRWL
jgi:hypothetical protein